MGDFKLKVIACCFVAAVFSQFALARQKAIELFSPDGTIKVSVRLADKIYYSVSGAGETLMQDNEAELQLREETLGKAPKLISRKSTSVDTEIRPVVPFKFSTVKDKYNQLLLNFKGDYSVKFRVYDDGIAYRFITRKKGTIEVVHENANFSFTGDYMLHTQFPGKRGFAAVYEDPYSHVESRQWAQEDDMSVLPVLIETDKGVTMLLSESDVSDYPCMFLKGCGEKNGAVSVFPPAPLETKDNLNIRVTKGADYIARTSGTREFPWRWLIIAGEDTKLIESTMAARLAPDNVIEDPSWIKPGLVLWDYLSRECDFGPKVNYVTGMNNATFKRYIDFAALNGIPYYCIDAGWAKDAEISPMETIPEVNLPEVLEYAGKKNVKLILWMFYPAVQRDFDNDGYNLFEYFSQMGVAGFKIDFMDRSDQDIVNFYERAMQEAAKYKMVIELHGSFTPRGLEYKYPNLLSYEGVLGMEYGSGCTPDNNAYLPFMRNMVGPMSFTPGIMFTTQPEHRHTGIGYTYIVDGTRAQHMAHYILFESGLQMISDSPRQYEQNPDCADFIFSTPVTWDETHAPAAKTGQYIVVAKRHGNKWWIGGITNGTEKIREFDIDLDFLPEGKTLRLTAFEDGPNSGWQAMDYNIRTRDVKNGDKLHIRMVKNGGFAAVIE